MSNKEKEILENFFNFKSAPQEGVSKKFDSNRFKQSAKEAYEVFEKEGRYEEPDD